MSLKTQIEIASSNYHRAVVEAVRNASPAELLEVFGHKSLAAVEAPVSKQKAEARSQPPSAKSSIKKRVRRTSERMKAMSEKVTQAVREIGGGSLGDVAKRMNMEKKKVVGPLRAAVRSGSIRKFGTTRGTEYVASATKPA